MWFDNLAQLILNFLGLALIVGLALLGGWFILYITVKIVALAWFKAKQQVNQMENKNG